MLQLGSMAEFGLALNQIGRDSADLMAVLHNLIKVVAI
jgi:hypothetical protein